MNIKIIKKLLITLTFTALLFISGCELTPDSAKNLDTYARDDLFGEGAKSKGITSETLDEALKFAVDAEQRGDIDKALYYYIQCLEFEPDNTQALFRIAKIHDKQGNHKIAIRAYTEALAADQSNVMAYQSLGVLEMENRQYKDAQGHLQKAILLDQKRLTTLGSAKIDGYHSLDKDSPVNSYNVSGIIEDIHKNFELARIYYKLALKFDEGSANILSNIGYSYYLTGDLSVAEKYYRKAINVDAKFKRAWSNLGLVYARKGQYRRAIKTFKQVMNEYDAYNDLGYFVMLEGRLDEAEYFFQKAIDMSPSYFKKAYVNLEQVQMTKRELWLQKQEAQGLEEPGVLSETKVENNESVTELNITSSKIAQEKATEEQLAQVKAAQDKSAQEQLAQKKAVQEKLAQVKAAEEKLAQDKLAQEQATQDKLAQVKAAEDKLAQDKLAQEQAAQEQLAQVKAAEDKLAQDKLVQEQATQEKLAQLKAAEDKLMQDQLAQEKAVQVRLLQDKLAQKKLSQDKLAQDKAVEEKLAQIKNAEDKLAQEKLTQEKSAQEKLAQVKAAQVKLLQDKIAQKKLVQEQLVLEKIAQDKLEQEKLVQEKVVQEQLAQVKAAQDKLAQDMLAQENLAQEKLTQEKQAQEKSAHQQLVQVKLAEKALAQEKAVQERLAQEKVEHQFELFKAEPTAKLDELELTSSEDVQMVQLQASSEKTLTNESDEQLDPNN